MTWFSKQHSVPKFYTRFVTGSGSRERLEFIKNGTAILHSVLFVHTGILEEWREGNVERAILGLQ